jgi:iron complex outermembrane recepter protein
MRYTVLAGVVSCFLLSAGVAGPADASVRKPTDIPAESLDLALRTLAKDRHLQVLYRAELVQDVRSPGASGALTPEEALTKVLSGTGLSYKYLDANTVTVISPLSLQTPPVAGPGSNPQNGSVTKSDNGGGKNTSQDFRVAQVDQGVAGPQVVSEDQNSGRKKRDDLTEIVVTGTHIHGVTETASPQIVITREDIEKTGYSTLEDVFRDLPQNFSGTTSAGSLATGGNSAISQQNAFGSTAIDLRGLGPESTLVLLNGQRRAGGDYGRAVDISTIPLSVIERAEIVTGGDSAVYGSDAVGGVVNLITRREFQGIESEAYYGAATNHGGGEQLNFSTITGTKGERGGVVVAVDYTNDHPLYLQQTGLYVSPLPSGIAPIETALNPPVHQYSGFFSGHFLINNNVELYGDGLYSSKTQSDEINSSLVPGATDASVTSSDNSIDAYNASGGVRISMGNSWTLDVSGNVGAQNETSRSPSFNDEGGGFTYSESYYLHNQGRLSSVSAVADGPLVSLAGVTPHVAVGVERRDERFETQQDETYSGGFSLVQTQGFERSRSVQSAFVELAIPFTQGTSYAWAKHLTLSIAGRYDDYSDLGHTTNPQLGLIWEPIAGLTLRGAFAKAFRAPSLYDYATPPFAAVTPLLGSPNPVLFLGGNNPNLEPERATTWSTGIDFIPSFSPATKLSFSYFDIDYRDRLITPSSTVGFVGGVQAAQENFGELLTQNPSLAQVQAAINRVPGGVISNYTQQPWDPATGAAGLLAAFPGLIVFDNRYTNVAIDRLQGLDLMLSTAMDFGTIKLRYGFNGTYTLEHNRQITQTTPTFAIINQVGEPVGFRASANAGLERRGYAAFAVVNYTNSYNNPFSTPVGRMASWTTMDLTLRAEGDKIFDSLFMRGFSASLSASNLLNRQPPEFLQSLYGPRFDSANANAIGRFVSLRLVKKW